MALGLLLVGGGLMAASQIAQGRAAEKQGEFANKIALRNQQALERQAKAEVEASKIEEERIVRREKIVSGQQIAAAGKTGGQIAGATLNFLADTARQFSLSRNFALRSGLFRSRELKEKGNIVAAEGSFAKSMGKFQRSQSYISAGGTLLSTAGAAGMFGGSSAGGGGWRGSFGNSRFGSGITSSVDPRIR